VDVAFGSHPDVPEIESVAEEATVSLGGGGGWDKAQARPAPVACDEGHRLRHRGAHRGSEALRSRDTTQFLQVELRSGFFAFALPTERRQTAPVSPIFVVSLKPLSAHTRMVRGVLLIYISTVDSSDWRDPLGEATRRDKRRVPGRAPAPRDAESPRRAPADGWRPRPAHVMYFQQLHFKEGLLVEDAARQASAEAVPARSDGDPGRYAGSLASRYFARHRRADSKALGIGGSLALAILTRLLQPPLRVVVYRRLQDLKGLKRESRPSLRS
jgi:hypothetical protein